MIHRGVIAKCGRSGWQGYEAPEAGTVSLARKSPVCMQRRPELRRPLAWVAPAVDGKSGETDRGSSQGVDRVPVLVLRAATRDMCGLGRSQPASRKQGHRPSLSMNEHRSSEIRPYLREMTGWMMQVIATDGMKKGLQTQVL